MLTLGFSPCPNDTFIFYAIMNKKIDTGGLEFDFVIKDIETLNNLALKNTLDITKVSCHTFYYIKNTYSFIRTGGAFGKGCGPLIISKKLFNINGLNNKKIAIPGKFTTAFLLLKILLMESNINPSGIIEMPFYDIMQAISSNKVDFGLIIHESRFTYQDHGFKKILDLGDLWEAKTNLPIPLGGIIAKKSIGHLTIMYIESLIRKSIVYAMSNKSETMPFIKSFSQELSDEVIQNHISLYVNNYSIDIGDEGLSSIDKLFKMADGYFSKLVSDKGE